MIPHLSLAWWLVGLFIIIFIWIFEASFRYTRKLSSQKGFEPQYITCFGMSWLNKKPLCPVCKTALGRYRNNPQDGNNYLTCPKCDKDYPLLDEEGKPLTQKKAIETLPEK